MRVRAASVLADFTRAIELDPNDPDPIYGIACTYALQQDIEHACIWLRRAIQMSSKYLDMTRTDSDFDAIRNTQESQALLREFESSHSP
jgi:hypothetical protein